MFGVNASSRLQNGHSPGWSSYCFTGIAPLHRLHFTITWPVSLARYEMASSRGRLAMCFSRSIDLCDCRPILPSSMHHLPPIAPFGFVCMGRFVVVLQPALPPLAASPNHALQPMPPWLSVRVRVFWCQASWLTFLVSRFRRRHFYVHVVVIHFGIFPPRRLQGCFHVHLAQARIFVQRFVMRREHKVFHAEHPAQFCRAFGFFLSFYISDLDTHNRLTSQCSEGRDCAAVSIRESRVPPSLTSALGVIATRHPVRARYGRTRFCSVRHPVRCR
jgi:hypothetical protein